MCVSTRSWRRSASSWPKRAQDAGRGRNDEPPDLQFARDRRAVHRSRATERHQRALARVVAALHRHDADAAHDVGVRHAQDAHSSRDRVDAKRAATWVSIAVRAASRSSCILPPSRVSLPSLPSTRLASEVVGLVPPRP